MTYFTSFALDNEKDILVNLYWDLDQLQYELETPNHHSGNLIRNLARLCQLPLSTNEEGLLVIRGSIPCFIDGDNREVYIFHMGATKVANIYRDGRVERKATIPSIAKTLMSQTREYELDLYETIFKTYIPRDLKFCSDLHTHMNANLPGDILIALGIFHEIRYPLYYIRKLDLALTPAQEALLSERRAKVERQFIHSDLKGKYLDRKINDNTFLNFASLILDNLDHAAENIVKIRTSLSILKDGQAVFTNLEKVYLYRYVFCKGQTSEDSFPLRNVDQIPDREVRRALKQMQKDHENPDYVENSLFQDCLLWIARNYRRQGISYAEISDTTLVKKYESLRMLEEVHKVMPAIFKETGVMLRFLAAIRRIPLTIVKDRVTPSDYLAQNVSVLHATALDPYVAGVDFVGEEINDIIQLKPVFREILKIAAKDPDFVIRVHAGENDSQKDNIAHSIACVRDSLAPGQAMPHMRIGHGLYTYSLTSRKGREVLRQLRDNHIVLEFQLTSNVRLNNLNSLKNHPLKQYLSAGISCVQGTDGAAIYGTDAMEEELALARLLHLSGEEMARMKEAETVIIENSKAAYQRKKRAYENAHYTEEKLLKLMPEILPAAGIHAIAGSHSRHFDANTELKEKIRELPWDRTPIILMGGSFNSERRTTRLREDGKAEIQKLLASISPEEYFFVVGHKLTGYEGFLVEEISNLPKERQFEVFAMVPSLLTAEEKKRLKSADVNIRVSPDLEGMGIYKSFNYEIFERRPSVLLAFDGNSAGENMIQEAKNGKGRAKIEVYLHAGSLLKKARSLAGYVAYFGDGEDLEV
ncbi:MAG: adenosine deaminase [Lachnospiraceae bacterium]|nr:adenosine deaminase [Lachnospiraceae bacterium]MDD6448716.1 adenosine deaminase [Lachnospiraceae bacterium]MDD6451910.1 adenosine deaminase [Lachnospiraceae bacterium]MDD6578624.1 adenosine deaminase [Lachnospiraceae bacterium]